MQYGGTGVFMGSGRNIARPEKISGRKTYITIWSISFSSSSCW